MNRRIFIFYTALITSTLFWSGCMSEDAADVNQDRIKASYSFIYDGELNETKASANFLFGSTYLRLSRPSEVTVNQQAMQEDEIFGIVLYERSFNGILNTGVFNYRNNESALYVNTIELPDPIDISIPNNQISRTNAQKIYWEGAPVGSNEIVTVSIIKDGIIHFESVDTRNSTFVEIEQEELMESFLGQASIRVERAINANSDDGSPLGASVVAKWQSEEYALTISN